METALFINNPSDIEKANHKAFSLLELPPAWKESPNNLSFSRIYFGAEFCERLLPQREAMEKILDAALKAGLQATFATPFITEGWLEKWADAAILFLKAFPSGEIVFNDLGFFNLMKNSGYSFTALLGRLLTKQKRGPRIQKLTGRTPGTMLEHFQSFGADNPLQADFCQNLGFVRYELDNPLQGIRRDSDIQASLHYPYFYITVTRMCLLARCLKEDIPWRAVAGCNRECLDGAFKITHESMGIPVYIAGNVQFGENLRLPQNPREIKINRLVCYSKIS